MQSSLIGDIFEELAAAVGSRSEESLFADGRPVMVYGAGSAGKDVCQLLVSRGITVTGFLDRAAKPGSTWKGIPIQAPQDPAIFASQRQGAHVVMGIFNAFVDIPPIVALLKDLGYGRVTTFLELHDHFASELGDRFWLTSRFYYQKLQSQAEAGFDLLCDDASRDLYARVLRFRFFMDYGVLPAPDRENQYFAKDLPSWASPLRFVDCGAFDGDSLRLLAATKTPIEAIAAFEPDLDNFAKLARHVRSNAAEMPAEVGLFPCGVGATTSRLHFSSGQGAGSHASEQGDTVIQCVSLDEALPRFRPNLIKMDIEGAEPEALRGARQLIAEYRPGLAICVYHRPEHLWEIPLLVRQLTGGGGRYFLRSHCFSGFDLVLYWLPD